MKKIEVSVKTFKCLLWASLMVNLVLAGMAAGHVWFRKPPIGPGIVRVIESLPPMEKNRVHERIDVLRPEFRERSRMVLRAQRDLIDRIETGPLSRIEMELALAEIDKRQAEFHRLLNQALVDGYLGLGR